MAEFAPARDRRAPRAVSGRLHAGSYSAAFVGAGRARDRSARTGACTRRSSTSCRRAPTRNEITPQRLRRGTKTGMSNHTRNGFASASPIRPAGTVARLARRALAKQPGLRHPASGVRRRSRCHSRHRLNAPIHPRKRGMEKHWIPACARTAISANWRAATPSARARRARAPVRSTPTRGRTHRPRSRCAGSRSRGRDGRRRAGSW